MSKATRTSRKTMRIATVFTGAAVAAVGFAPAALAAPTAPPAPGRPPAPASSIRRTGCTTNQWVHISYESIFRTECAAYGFVGISTAGFFMKGYCGGNNFGQLLYSSGKVRTYGNGNTYNHTLSGDYLSAIKNSGWNKSNKDTCAWPT